jgi:hypothetical protein
MSPVMMVVMALMVMSYVSDRSRSSRRYTRWVCFVCRERPGAAPLASGRNILFHVVGPLCRFKHVENAVMLIL